MTNQVAQNGTVQNASVAAVMDPAAFQGRAPAQAFAGLDANERLSEGIGSSYGILGYKGKVWSLRINGQRHVFTRPDDGSPVNHIDVVILRQAHQKSKSYYDGYDDNSEGKRPLCASLNGVTPDRDIATPQATACAICPRNVWKEGQNGRKSRECTDYKRLAVLLLPTQTAPLLGEALMEPVFLRVPPASLTSLGNMGDYMSSQGFAFSSYVTRISFDPAEASPKMIFRAIQPLTDAEGPVVLPLREDPQSLRITGEDVVNGEQGALAAPAQAPALAAPVNTGFATQVAPAQAAPAQASPAPTVPTQPVSTGFTTSPPPQQATQPQAPAPEAAQESDAAMDARIAGMLN